MEGAAADLPPHTCAFHQCCRFICEFSWMVGADPGGPEWIQERRQDPGIAAGARSRCATHLPSFCLLFRRISSTTSAPAALDQTEGSRRRKIQVWMEKAETG